MLLAQAVCLLGFAAAIDREVRYDFEQGAAGWVQPGGGSGIVLDPGQPRNHAYCIVATKPHHTQLVLAGSEASPDFIASARFRIVESTGEAPVVYCYGRLGGSFRAISVRSNVAHGMSYFGQGGAGQQFDQVSLPANRTWTRVKLACFGNFLAGKAWSDGEAEPNWQIRGEVTTPQQGRFALGVWTSPRTPSTARVLFDDVEFHPASAAEIAALRRLVAPREPLAVGKIGADGYFENDDVAGLATPVMVVAFDKRTGGLAHLVDRTSGRDFVDSRSRRPLFIAELVAPEDRKSAECSAADFRRVTIRKVAAGKLELVFGDLPARASTAVVTAATDSDGYVRLRMSFEGQGGMALAELQFPLFTAPVQLGESVDDDRLLIPNSDGAVLEAPGSRTQSRHWAYPGGACVQLMAYYDATAGLYLATHDADGHCKQFGFATNVKRSVELPVVHRFPETVPPVASLPYDVVLGTFHGDWHAAADRYKRWAVAQPWCRTTLANRSDIPDFLKKGAGVVIVGIQNQHGYNGLFGPDLEKLPEFAAKYRNATGLAHIIIVPYGWEGRGTWAGINYFPTVPSDAAWKTAAAALRDQGDRVAMLTSGFWWVVKRKATSNGPAFDDSAEFERRQEMVIHAPDRRPWLVDTYDKTSVFGDWRGLSVSLCHGSAAAQKTMHDIFLRTAGLGAALVSFDQEIGGSQSAPCYSATHGHAPGYGAWMWTDFRDLCQSILRDGKRVQPELGLFMENCSELAIPCMATYWSRQFGEIDHGATGARGVGLFSYLYHEYVTAIGAACVQGQGVLGTRAAADLRCQVLANNLVRGLIPGPFANDVPLEPTSDWHKQVSHAYFAFCRPYAHFSEYLLLGKTVPPPAVTCGTHDAWFYRQDASGESLKPGGPKVIKATVRLPDVIAGQFAAADGSMAVVIVNTTNAARRATVAMTPGGAAVLYRANRSIERRIDALPAALELSLEPFGVRVLVVKLPGR